MRPVAAHHYQVMLGCLANAVQPYAGARVFHTFGWDALFGLYAAAFLVAMTMWAIIDPTRTFYDLQTKSIEELAKH